MSELAQVYVHPRHRSPRGLTGGHLGVLVASVRWAGEARRSGIGGVKGKTRDALEERGPPAGSGQCMPGTCQCTEMVASVKSRASQIQGRVGWHADKRHRENDQQAVHRRKTAQRSLQGTVLEAALSITRGNEQVTAGGHVDEDLSAGGGSPWFHKDFRVVAKSPLIQSHNLQNVVKRKRELEEACVPVFHHYTAMAFKFNHLLSTLQVILVTHLFHLEDRQFERKKVKSCHGGTRIELEPSELILDKGG
ncbi:hypothetical protein C8R44DRAFT_744235 [Mycena epipterygia]|nr:hypothetical protein C8R44DRAFT_744235 [Mycena epipterygia]